MMCARVMAAPLLILGLALFSADRAEAQQQGVWVVKSSPHSVPVTVEKLTSAIERAGAPEWTCRRPPSSSSAIPSSARR
jgi:hypothetical protein